MDHFKSIMVKFFAHSIIILFVFLFYGFSFSSLLFLSAILALVSYGVGDLAVLPLRGNLQATLCDGAIVFLGIVLWTAPSYGLYTSLLAGALFCAIIIAVCEWFIHIYVIGRSLRDDPEPIYD